MKPQRVAVHVSLWLLLGCAGSTAARQGGRSGADRLKTVTRSVMGRVIEEGTGQYLEGATVTLKGTERGMLTDSSGRYRISDLPPGTAVISVQMIGYVPEERQVPEPWGDRVILPDGQSLFARTDTLNFYMRRWPVWSASR